MPGSDPSLITTREDLPGVGEGRLGPPDEAAFCRTLRSWAAGGARAMSWYGRHPRATRAEVQRLLPPAACKLCVYSFRILWPDIDRVAAAYAGYCCPRCGICWGDAAAAIARTLAAGRSRGAP
jgi:hypothetical protein